MTSRPSLALVLLDAVEKQTFDPQENLTALHARQLRTLGDVRVSAAVDRIWGRTSESSADAATVARLKQAFNDLPLGFLDPLRGKEVFQRLCSSCHMLDGDGEKSAPTSRARRITVSIISSIISSIKRRHRAGLPAEPDHEERRLGRFRIIEHSTDTSLVVRTSGRTRSPFRKAESSPARILEQSMMPAGLLEAVTQREALDLLRFLLVPRR